MKRVIYTWAFVCSMVFVSCSKSPIEDKSTCGCDIAVSVYNPGSKMSVTPESDCWSVDWEADDDVVGWFSSTATMEKFSMSSLDAESGLAQFRGTGYIGEQMRFIYPYDPSIVNNGGSITLSVAEQSVDLSSDTPHDSFGERGLYMLCERFNVDEAESTTTTMRHIFTMLELTFNVDGIVDEELVVESVSISGLGDSSVTIPFDYEYTDVLTTVDGDSDTITLSVDGASALSNGDGALKIPIVAVPFELTDGQQIEWTVTFSDGGEVSGTKIISGAFVGNEYKRAEYNTFLIDFDAADVTYSSVEPSEFALSYFDGDNAIPTSDTWVITDSSIAKSGENNVKSPAIAGLMEDLETAQEGGRAINLKFQNLETIENSLFYDTSITSVEFPKVTTIEDRAFNSCTSLTSIDLPIVETMGQMIFWGCSSITEISLPEVTTIGHTCFRACAELTTVSMPKLSSLGNQVFYSSPKLASLTMGVVGEGVGTITSTSFKLIGADVTLNIKRAVDANFKIYGNTMLIDETTIFIPVNNIVHTNETISTSAIDDIVTIPDVDRLVITDSEITAVQLSGLTTLLADKGGYVNVEFSGLESIAAELFKTNAAVTFLSFPNVETIADKAFNNAASMVGIDLPKTTAMGTNMFYGCSKLVSFYGPDVTSIVGNTFRGTTAEVINLPSLEKITGATPFFDASVTRLYLGDEGNGISLLKSNTFGSLTTANVDLTIKLAAESNVVIDGNSLTIDGGEAIAFSSIVEIK